MSFEVILPFLRPIAHLIQDPDVTEIMVNGSRRIFVERQGLIEAVDGIEIDERNLKVAVKNIARALGDDASEEKPILDSRLPDGSRVAAVFPPVQRRRHDPDDSQVSDALLHGRGTRPDRRDDRRRAGAHPNGDRQEREHPDQRRDQHRQDDDAERARRRSCRRTIASCSSKTPRSCRSTGRTWYGSRPGASNPACRLSRFATC